MEGVWARLGRSSTRFGPATVFTGPVRKWKRKWVDVSPSTNKANNSSSAAAGNNGGSNSDGSNESHLLLYKWAPLSQASNGNGNGDGNIEINSPRDDSVTAAAEDLPRRRFKYVPIAVLEEQKKKITKMEEDDNIEEDDKIEVDNKVEQEDKVNENKSLEESSEKKTEVVEKLDINDIPMEEYQYNEKIARQDLNESTMDLGLNVNGNDVDTENNPKESEPLEE